ncbi:tetratricopeptide repeat protein [Aquimarina megaterium]|uniref:tetratricopeptide repeat protein n=1 Tax=Aquimarina megaterium TaxID=1443666 RepID=UPI00046ED299|nr:tetratricopeptide repeat protein [Aquimarina megaterium]
MKTEKFILLFLSFVSITALFSQEVDTTLVRLTSALDMAIEDTTKVKAMLELGEYQLKRDFSSAEGYFDQGLTLLGNKTENHYQKFRTALYVQLGVVHRRKAEYPKAIEYYVEALKYYEQNNNVSKIADVYHNMALVYRYQKEHRRAIENYKKAIALKEKVKDTFGMGAGYNMLGVSYRQNKQLDSALICYQKAEELFTAINSKEDLHGVYGNLAVLYGIQGKYNQSIPLKKANLAYYKKIGKRLSICVEYYNLSEDFKKMKDWPNCLKYTDSSLQVALEEGFAERISVAYRRKSFVNAKMGDFEDAYQNYRKFNRKSDEIFNLKNAKKMQALELSYQFEKEKQADSLKFAQQKHEVELIAETEASKKRLYFILLMISVLGAMIIGYLVRRNYIQRSKVTQLEFENQKAILDRQIKAKEENIKHLIADNSMRLAFKEELLNKIKNEIIDEDPKNMITALNSLTTQLQRQISTEGKLSGLQEKINDVNQNFDNALKKLYPDLTKGEREVCALLRLNLSIKEIMTVRDVSSDSVKSMRRRIRKKMKIPSDIELEKFIRSLV